MDNHHKDCAEIPVKGSEEPALCDPDDKEHLLQYEWFMTPAGFPARWDAIQKGNIIFMQDEVMKRNGMMDGPMRSFPFKKQGRTQKEIMDMMVAGSDFLWYFGHKRRHEEEGTKCKKDGCGCDKALAMEKECPDIKDSNDFLEGKVGGGVGALRWVLGHHWDFLDT